MNSNNGKINKNISNSNCINFSKITRNQKTVLSKLIDQYESSATFQGRNKVNQSFSVRPGKLFPAYLDDAEYDFFVTLNEEMAELESAGMVSIVRKNGRIDRIALNTDKISDVYDVLSREPRDQVQKKILDYLNEQEERITRVCYKADQVSRALNDYLIDDKREMYETVTEESYTELRTGRFANKKIAKDENTSVVFAEQTELSRIYHRYIEEQRKRIADNRSVEYFDGDMKEYEDIWKVLIVMLDIEDEIYVRDLSVKLFHDSKKLEKIRSKIESLLYAYGEYPERKYILEEHGIIQTPSYVMVKGNVVVSFGGQKMDIGRLHGDVAFSTESLKDITDISVYGNRVVTIENLTSFHRYDCKTEDVAIYLSGYHNRVKRNFLKLMYKDNPGVTYYHFGDIDAGGFYIYEHLKRKTGIPFRTMNMDMETLIKYKEYSKKLTGNDVKRIEKLIEKYERDSDYHEDGDLSGKKSVVYENVFMDRNKKLKVLKTMIEMGIKLEQEAVWG